MTSIINPLVDSAPSEVMLKSAPLERVIFQVRFPLIMSIGQPEFVASFQEAIRSSFPILRREVGLALGSEGILMQPVPQVSWRFYDSTDEHWRLSLTPDFVALETTKYQSRTDFLDRMGKVLRLVEKHIRPTHFDRIGVRFINRVFFESLAEVSPLVKPEVFGLLATSMWPQANQFVSQCLFSLANGRQFSARTALLPPNATVDLTSIAPSSESSWVLDLDMFDAAQAEFDPRAIVEQGGEFFDRIYTFFRWSVTPAFLKRYGGTP